MSWFKNFMRGTLVAKRPASSAAKARIAAKMARSGR